MANLSELISQQVLKAASGVEIPANLKNQVLGGLSDSILGSFTQTAATTGGIDAIKALLSGRAAVASSPVTALAGDLFTRNILGKLNLGKVLGGSLTALIPVILTNVSGIFKDRDGDGDVDLNDIIGGLLGSGSGLGQNIFKGILGGILGRK